MKKTDSPGKKPAKEKPIKITDAHRLDRFETIIKAWTDGHRTSSIIKMQMERWGISEPTAYRDLNKAKEDLAAIAAEKKEILIGRSVGLMDGIIREAIRMKSPKVAIDAAKHRDTVLGLTGKIELTGQLDNNVNNIVSPVTEQALVSLARALERQETKPNGGQSAPRPRKRVPKAKT